MASNLNRPESRGSSLWPLLRALTREDDGQAAKAHLSAGRPIYYGTADTPPGHAVKEHSDGRRELVRFDHLGEHHVRDAE